MEFQTIRPKLERKSEPPLRVLSTGEIRGAFRPPTMAPRGQVVLPVPPATAEKETFLQRYALFIAAAAFAGALIILALVQPYLPGVPH